MDFDKVEFESIESDQYYKDQIARSRQNASPILPKIVDDDLVEFYGSRTQFDPFGKWLSNCTYSPLIINGVSYRSSEHYYQIQKFTIRVDDPTIIDWCKRNRISPEDQLKVNANVHQQMATMTPVGVARFGQTTRNVPIRGDWEDVKRQVMYDAVLAKFIQNKDFANELIKTGNAVLVERAPTDSIWAINHIGKGSNWLGITLMMVRSILE